MQVELDRMVVILEDDTFYSLRHGVALCCRGVLPPALGQFVDGLQTVEVEKLQIADAVPCAGDNDLAKG